MLDYQTFLSGKKVAVTASGFEIPRETINPALFPFQGDSVQWLLRIGRGAAFFDTGLGKTLMQLEWAYRVSIHTERPVLILAPLAVSGQTRAMGEDFGYQVTVCRQQSDAETGINITNYESLHKFNPSQFAGVVLDESSILKSYTGTTKQALIEAFHNTPYKLCCTATPAPNDLLELGNHADFLGIMPSNEMISRWFINDSMEFGNYRLKKHAVRDFYRWVASWSLCVSDPGDLGHKDARFKLPELQILHHIVGVEDLPAGESKDGQALMFRGANLSATSLHSEMRITAERRAQKVADLVSESIEIEPESWLIWVNTNYEADAIMQRLAGAVEVRGSDPAEEKERCLLGFASGEIQILVTKPSIAGFGMNFQVCRNVVFMGLSYSYEQFYQALRRVWRFGQKREVFAHIVAAESEGSVLEAVKAKEANHQKMKAEMNLTMREDQMNNLYGKRELTFAPEPEWTEGDRWKLGLGDCVDATGQLADKSIGYTIFSPPFSNLYIYSDSVADMGNSKDDAEFHRHFMYLIFELFRVTIPGRLCTVHCKDLPMYKGRDGAAGLRDFPGDIIRAFTQIGWQFHSRCTIWKDPVIEMQRTKNHGLLYKELCKDSSCSRQGMSDYLITFRKWNDEGIFPDAVKGDGERFDTYVGLEPPDPTEIAQRFNLPIPHKVKGKWPAVNPFIGHKERHTASGQSRSGRSTRLPSGSISIRPKS